MTSIGPTGRSSLGAAPAPETDPDARPETVRLAFRIWLAVASLECVHQLMNVVKGLFDSSELREQAKQGTFGMKNFEPTEQQLDFAIYFSLVTSAGIAILIMGIVAYGAWRFYQRMRYAENMRRMLLFFGIYLAICGFTPFLMVPNAAVPTAITLFDGYLQILIAVGATIAAIYGSKAESVEWAKSGASSASQDTQK
ncbi:hypothetical protein QVA66_07260 [Staphylococcus chromogenes]|nr:hypothetical protein [Staphylococcus chromogenes]